MVDQERLALLRERVTEKRQRRKREEKAAALREILGDHVVPVPGVEAAALFRGVSLNLLNWREVDPATLAGQSDVRFAAVAGYAEYGVWDQPHVLARLVARGEEFSFVSADLRFVHAVYWPEHTDQRYEMSARRTPAGALRALREYVGASSDDAPARDTTDPFVTPGGRIVFVGDGITACGRDNDPDGLGTGYVSTLDADVLAVWDVRNQATAGERVGELRARVQRDVVDLNPDVVSVLVGIHDLVPVVEGAALTPLDEFIVDYRAILDSLRRAGIAIIVVEPFVDLGVAPNWARSIHPAQEAIARLATDAGATFVPTQSAFTNPDFRRIGARTTDGVHPTPLGQSDIARAWETHAAARVRSLA